MSISAELGESTSLAKWSSLELLAEEDDSPPPIPKQNEDSIFSHSYLQRVASERGPRRPMLIQTGSVDHGNHDSQPGSPGAPVCATSVLILVLHGGSVLDVTMDLPSKKSDLTTFRGSFEAVIRQHYPSLVGHVAIRLVPCPSICTDALGILSSLSPYSFDVPPSTTDLPNMADIPIGAIPLLATCTADYQDSVNRSVNMANQVYQEFLRSEDGKGFSGHVAIIGDSMGGVIAHDALCRSKGHLGQDYHHSDGGGTSGDEVKVNEYDLGPSKLLSAPSPRRRSSSTSDSRLPKFEFDVADFFMFGSPLACVLAARRLQDPTKYGSSRPNCSQIYNFFHPTHPTASRLEPILSARFSVIAPVNIPRYAKYPLGSGQPYHLCEYRKRKAIAREIN